LRLLKCFLFGLFVLTMNIQVYAQQTPKQEILSDELLNFGYISCPEETDIAELERLTKTRVNFDLIYLEKILNGKCTKRIAGMSRLANVERKSGGYYCFNTVLPFGTIDEKMNCAISTDVIRIDEAQRKRNGKFKVYSRTPSLTKAECDEGDVYAQEQQKVWYSVGVFSATFGAESTTLPGPQLIKRAKRDDALRDACRGLLQ
jgi:hypothetical protein